MKFIEMIAGSKGMGDAKSMAEMLRRMGRRGDTMLAHITPEEADMLMQAGGAGTINPDTGLPEFYSYGYSPSDYASETDLYSRNYEGGAFDDARMQAVDRRESPRTIRLRNEARNFDETNIVPYTPQPNDVPPPSMGDPEVRYYPDYPADFTIDRSTGTSIKPQSVYERLTGRERPEDLMQMSPFTRAYDAATGNRVQSMEDPYSQALSTYRGYRGVDVPKIFF